MARKTAAYTLVKRGKKGIYSVRFTTPDGEPVFRSSGTSDRALATEWASKIHAETYRISRLGDKRRYTWDEATLAWLDDHAGKRSLDKDLQNITWLKPHLSGVNLDTIDADLLASISSARRNEPRDKRVRKDGKQATTEPTSQSTVNRMLALIRSILKDASRRGWLDAPPQITLVQEEQHDHRWLTRDEAEKLYAELADHLKPIYLFSLATGLREQNAVRLEWGRVDLQRNVAWVNSRQAKGKRGIGVPLNRDAVAILKAQKGKHPRWVFPNEQGVPFSRMNNTGFHAAQRRAGIAPIKWHGLRHTWASWHVIGGTSLRSLMELGGWRSIQSVLRYAHLSPEHLAKDAARIEGLAQNLHK